MKIIQKSSSETDFYQFWLDFGLPRRPQNHQKWIKKQAPKNSKKIDCKKGSKTLWPPECAGRGEDIGGEKKTSKTAKNDAKN